MHESNDKADDPKRGDIDIPPILLEGDMDVGHPKDVLPVGYGTGHVFATPRDPHWLHLTWDLSSEHIHEFNQHSVDGHLVLRIFSEHRPERLHSIAHVHPESTSWVVFCGRPGGGFRAELGYFREGEHGEDWVCLGTSPLTRMPGTGTERRWTPAADARPTPAEQPQGPPTSPSLWLNVQGPVSPDQINAPASPEAAFGRPAAQPPFSAFPEASPSGPDVVPTSHLFEAVDARMAAFLPTDVSSPEGLADHVIGRKRGFWMNVNAELIIYGTTDPQASLSIAGQPVRLRADGGFSFRFAFPDGDYILPIVAVSPDGEETRSATLEFRRASRHVGLVDTHPQDPTFTAPDQTSFE